MSERECQRERDPYVPFHCVIQGISPVVDPENPFIGSATSFNGILGKFVKYCKNLGVAGSLGTH